MGLNPFLCNTYQKHWKKYFANDSRLESLPMIPDLGFVKTSRLPIWHNVGGTQTKGITYKITQQDLKGLDNIIVVYGVPSTMPSSVEALGRHNLKILISDQYLGFLCDFEGYTDLKDYLRNTLSKNSRAKLRYYEGKSVRELDISYRMYRSEISKETFDDLFVKFHELLAKRFRQKKEFNVNISTREWEFYHEMTFPMLRENRAGLFVTYDRDEPIAFSLLFIEGERLIDTIRVFDTAYSKYRIGSLSIYALMGWCYENHYKKLDFSKGDFEYKRRWANIHYKFNYHVIYNPKSFRLKLVAYLTFLRFELKQFLRKLNFNYYYNRVRYRLARN